MGWRLTMLAWTPMLHRMQRCEHQTSLVVWRLSRGRGTAGALRRFPLDLHGKNAEQDDLHCGSRRVPNGSKDTRSALQLSQGRPVERLIVDPP